MHTVDIIIKKRDGGTLIYTSPSPGQIARYLKNKFYKTDEEYLYTLADVMAREYRAIVEAGFILQLDCPDLAMSYALYPGIGIGDYRKIIARNVEALNAAVQALPAPYREAFVLVKMEGCSYRQAAEWLGVPTGTLQSRLWRAVRLLQSALEDPGEPSGLRLG